MNSDLGVARVSKGGHRRTASSGQGAAGELGPEWTEEVDQVRRASPQAFGFLHLSVKLLPSHQNWFVLNYMQKSMKTQDLRQKFVPPFAFCLHFSVAHWAWLHLCCIAAGHCLTPCIRILIDTRIPAYVTQKYTFCVCVPPNKVRQCAPTGSLPHLCTLGQWSELPHPNPVQPAAL